MIEYYIFLLALFNKFLMQRIQGKSKGQKTTFPILIK
jgi:hypothetical protein